MPVALRSREEERESRHSEEERAWRRAWEEDGGRSVRRRRPVRIGAGDEGCGLYGPEGGAGGKGEEEERKHDMWRKGSRKRERLKSYHPYLPLPLNNRPAACCYSGSSAP